MNLITFAAALLLAGIASTVAAATDIAGPARVIDGDTIVIAGTHVRLWGIDAPEHDQTCQGKNGQAYLCGQYATGALYALVGAGTIACTPLGHDRYGRTVAVCHNGSAELNATMVRSGWALDYTKYSGGRYRIEEQEARGHQLGLWAGWFELPEKWRQRHATSHWFMH